MHIIITHILITPFLKACLLLKDGLAAERLTEKKERESVRKSMQEYNKKKMITKAENFSGNAVTIEGESYYFYYIFI